MGRGPLAGPLVTNGVLIRPFSTLPKKFVSLVKDSKKLNAKQREYITKMVKELPQIVSSTSVISVETINKIGIEKSIFMSFQNNIKKIKSKVKTPVNLLLIDGNKIIPNFQLADQKSIIKGDNKIFAIALASIIAKDTRDKIMIRYAKQYQQYQFDVHKGYGTQLHFELIKKYGPCAIHRKSFYPISQYFLKDNNVQNN